MLCDCLKLELYRLQKTVVLIKLQKVNKSGKRIMQDSQCFYSIKFFQFPLQFVFWVGVYTKTIRQLGLVVSEQIVNSGCALVDYQLIDNSSSLSNCQIAYSVKLPLLIIYSTINGFSNRKMTENSLNTS